MYPQTVADVIRTCLGPKAMLKMILDPMGGILYVLKPLRRFFADRVSDCTFVSFQAHK